MSKVILQYRCRRCDELESNVIIDAERGQRFMLYVAAKGEAPFSESVADELSIHGLHRCLDGGTGLTDIAGCKAINESTARVPLR